MIVTPWLKAAGRYPVEPLAGYPHWSSAVDLVAPRAGVLHTTEGPTCASALAVFRAHPWGPHFVVGPESDGKVHIYQTTQVGTIAGCLEQHNVSAVVQIEMVGYSQEKSWLPPDDLLDAVAALLAQCQISYGVPLYHPWLDGDFGLYGPNAHRSSGKFGQVAGWFGHADIPDNSHWDPGNVAWSVLFDRARSMTDILYSEDAVSDYDGNLEITPL